MRKNTAGATRNVVTSVTCGLAFAAFSLARKPRIDRKSSACTRNVVDTGTPRSAPCISEFTNISSSFDVLRFNKIEQRLPPGDTQINFTVKPLNFLT